MSCTMCGRDQHLLPALEDGEGNQQEVCTGCKEALLHILLPGPQKKYEWRPFPTNIDALSTDELHELAEELGV